MEGKEDRMTLRLTPEARETLEWIQEQRSGVPLVEVIRRALGTERLLMEYMLDGATILIEPRRGRTKELRLV